MSAPQSRASRAGEVDCNISRGAQKGFQRDPGERNLPAFGDAQNRQLLGAYRELNCRPGHYSAAPKIPTFTDILRGTKYRQFQP